VGTDPLFEIGNDETGTSSSNAVTVLKNGKVGIGTNNPLSLLSVGGTGFADYTINAISPVISGRGIYGHATYNDGINYGGYFKADGTDGRGIYGFATSTSSGSSYGGYFQSDGANGIGVYGIANNNSATTGWGGYFEAFGADGIGVYGFGGGLAGKFVGNVEITGNLSKSSGSFKIDHPLDPENKYLFHSFVESPDMMNIYNGNIELDAFGEASIEMPDWFEALNMEFRYQLTAIGSPGPNLYIAEEISSNQFKISGGKAGMKVSWQVTGIRHDAFANENRIQVEEMKKPKLRGKYLHPEVFNMPITTGVNYNEKMEQDRTKIQAERN